MLIDREPSGYRTFVQKTLYRRKSPGLIAGGVRLAFAWIELVQLLPLGGETHPILIGEIEFIAIPVELPRDHQVDHARVTLNRPDRHRRQPQRAGHPGDGPRMLRPVERLDRKRNSMLGAGRNRPHVAGLAAAWPWPLGRRGGGRR